MGSIEVEVEGAKRWAVVGGVGVSSSLALLAIGAYYVAIAYIFLLAYNLTNFM